MSRTVGSMALISSYTSWKFLVSEDQALFSAIWLSGFTTVVLTDKEGNSKTLCWGRWNGGCRWSPGAILPEMQYRAGLARGCKTSAVYTQPRQVMVCFNARQKEAGSVCG